MLQITKNVTVTMYRRPHAGAERVRVASGPFIIMAYGLTALARQDPKADIWIEAPGGRMTVEGSAAPARSLVARRCQCHAARRRRARQPGCRSRLAALTSPIARACDSGPAKMIF